MRVPEFSKKLVNKFLWIFLIHTVLSIAAMVIAKIPDSVASVYAAAIPLYITVFGGYYGKAAIENAKKITTSITTATEENG